MPSLDRAVSAFLGQFSAREAAGRPHLVAGAEKPGPTRHPLAARTPDLGEDAMYKELRSMPTRTQLT